MSFFTIKHFLDPFTVIVEGRYRRVGVVSGMCLGRARYSLYISTVTVESRVGGGGTHVVAGMCLATVRYSLCVSTVTVEVRDG